MLIRYAFKMSRLWDHFHNSSFAVISAWLSGLKENENRHRHKLLKQAVRDLGYGYQEVLGYWKGVPEQTLFIPNISKQDAVTLGHGLFDEELPRAQEAIVYADGERIYLLETEDGQSKVLDTFTQLDIGDMTEAWDAYSVLRGRTFKFGSVEWDMVTPPKKNPGGFVGGLVDQKYDPNEPHDFYNLTEDAHGGFLDVDQVETVAVYRAVDAARDGKIVVVRRAGKKIAALVPWDD